MCFGIFVIVFKQILHSGDEDFKSFIVDSWNKFEIKIVIRLTF